MGTGRRPRRKEEEKDEKEEEDEYCGGGDNNNGIVTVQEEYAAAKTTKMENARTASAQAKTRTTGHLYCHYKSAPPVEPSNSKRLGVRRWVGG
jgi:hypothetical protein